MIEERVAALEARLRTLLSLKPIAEAQIEHEREQAELQAKSVELTKEEAEKKRVEDVAAARAAAEVRGPEALKRFDEEQAAREKAEAERLEAEKHARQVAADLAAEHAKLAQERIANPDYVAPPGGPVA
jgi:colicin import membrane protein